MTLATPPATKRPGALTPRPYRFPRFERRTIGNGIRLLVAPVRKMPLVTVCVVVDAGAVADLPDREGIAQLAGDLLLEGTATDSGADIAVKFERLGADVDVRTDWDACVVSITALRQHLEPSVRLLGSVLRAPSFPPHEVERLKSERLAELLRLRAEPRALADDMFAHVLYQDCSRYTRPLGGIERSVNATTVADVRRFYEARYRAQGVTLIVAGDVDVDDAERLAGAAFAEWTGSHPPAARTDDAPARRERALHLVAKPDAQQAELRIGHVGLSRPRPDYHAVAVMNAVLGGLFSSRINLNLREKHGYTYGAFSRFDWRRQAGPFMVSSAVQNEVVALAAKEVIGELERIRESEVSADELSLATSYLDGVFPIRYETTESIAEALVTLSVFGLPDDFHDTYCDRVRAITTRDVLAAARQYLHPDQLQLVVVGDTGKVRAQLEELSFGPPAVHDPTDDRAW